MKVFTSVIIEAPLTAVWSAVRAFDGVVHWNPAVCGAQMDSGANTAVGAIRRLDILDGSVFRETLLAHSDIEHFYTYDIIESPLPCSNYVSTHRFMPITDGNQTLGIWSGEFDCDAKDAESLRKIVGDDIYRDGMRGLNAYLKG